MINKLIAKTKYGMFSDHFAQYFIENKADKEAFEVYYETRIGAVSMAGVLGYDFLATEDKLTMTHPTTGKKYELTFGLGVKYDTENAQEAHLEDCDSLDKLTSGLINEVKEKTGKKDISSFEEAEVELVNYLKNNGMGDQFEVQKFVNLFISATEEINKARLTTPSVDMDIVMSASVEAVGKLYNLLLREANSGGDITIQTLLHGQRASLVKQMRRDIPIRELERECILRSGRTPKDVSFWEYKAMMNRISNCPEMW